MPLFWFSSSKASVVQQTDEHYHGKVSVRMIFGCQKLDNMSKNVRNPLPGKKSRIRPEDRACSPSTASTNRKGLHASSCLSTSNKQLSHFKSPARLNVDAANCTLIDGVPDPQTGGSLSGTSEGRAQRSYDRFTKGADVKVRRRLSFGCEALIQPHLADSSKNKSCELEETLAATTNLDNRVDGWENCDGWNVSATVKNKLVSKRSVMLRKTKGYKKIQSSLISMHDNQLDTLEDQKDAGRSHRRTGSNVICSYTRLSASSMDHGALEEDSDGDREPSSFASGRPRCVQRSYEKEDHVFLGRSSLAGESDFHETDSTVRAASEKHCLRERTSEKSTSVSLMVAFRAARKLASDRQRKRIPSKLTDRRRKTFTSKSLMMFDHLSDTSRPLLREHSHLKNLESSSKRWISIPSLNIVQQRDSNIEVSKANITSAYSSRSLLDCGYEQNHDAVAVNATVSPSPITPTTARKVERQQPFCITTYPEDSLQIDLPSNAKKVSESVPMAKTSYNPYRDFKSSMLEMIFSKKIRRPSEMKDLLECYITLNSPSYQEIIIDAFEDVWQQICCSTSAQSTTPTSPLSA